jgi:hypothetical protein
MGSGVVIVCEGFAADFIGHAVPGSYFARVEERPSGGITVHWTDIPDEAAVFEDIAAAVAFSRQEPLTLFGVSFAPAPGSAEAPDGAPAPAAAPAPEPVDLAAELRTMGLM